MFGIFINKISICKIHKKKKDPKAQMCHSGSIYSRALARNESQKQNEKRRQHIMPAVKWAGYKVGKTEKALGTKFIPVGSFTAAKLQIIFRTCKK